MDGTSYAKYRGFSRGRDAEKLGRTALSGRKKVSFNTYNINDFKLLGGTRHIDDEDGLPYKMVGDSGSQRFHCSGSEATFLEAGS